MHNVGSLAMIVDGTSPDPSWATRIGRRWLTFAVNIRKGIVGDFIPVAVAALQIETIGALAYVLYLLREDDELLQVAWCAVEYGEPHGAALNQIGTNVPEALRMIREAVEQRHLADRELRERLQALEESTSQRQQRRQSVAPLIDKLQQDMLNAVAMVDQASLADGVDLALRATETALAEGVLVTKSIDCLLDIGIALLIAVAQRPADNQHPRQLIIGLLEGLAPLAESLHSSQRARMNLLEATGAGGSQRLRQAIADAGRVVDDDQEILKPWIYVAEGIADQYARQGLFTKVPEGVRVVNSSDDLLYWEAVDTARTVPMLFIHNPGAFVIDSTGRHPSGHAPFVEAGLTITTDPAAIRPLAHDWYLRFEHDGLRIYSADGQALVQQIRTSSEFTNRMRQAGGVLLVYRDATQPIYGPLTAPAGWIPLPQSPRRGGWRRLIPW